MAKAIFIITVLIYVPVNLYAGIQGEGDMANIFAAGFMAGMLIVFLLHELVKFTS